MEQIKMSDGIRLYSGVMFDYSRPEIAPVSIDDIAHGLSNICRFAGQCKHFYSVAQHAVLASTIVAPEFAFTALLHDTAEAFTNDIPRPMKSRIPGFKELEENIENAMAQRFGFQYPLPPEVRRADDIMLKLEKNELMPQDTSNWVILDYLGDVSVFTGLVDLSSWDPRRAKQEFLDRYEELRP